MFDHFSWILQKLDFLWLDFNTVTVVIVIESLDENWKTHILYLCLNISFAKIKMWIISHFHFRTPTFWSQLKNLRLNMYLNLIFWWWSEPFFINVACLVGNVQINDVSLQLQPRHVKCEWRKNWQMMLPFTSIYFELASCHKIFPLTINSWSYQSTRNIMPATTPAPSSNVCQSLLANSKI